MGGAGEMKEESSLCGKAHFVGKLTSWESSASLGAWRVGYVDLVIRRLDINEK